MLEDQLQMKNERDGKNKSLSQKESLENNDEFEVGEFCVPSPKVIQHENILSKIKKSIKRFLHVEQPTYLLLCKGILTCIVNTLEPKKLSLTIDIFLKEFDDIFPKEGLIWLPPFRVIEHQIYLVPKANLPNRLAYKTNPPETKEIKSQVQDLLEDGWVQKSLSPYIFPIFVST